MDSTPLLEKPERRTRPRISDRLVAEALQAADGLAVLAARKLGCSPSLIYARIRQNPKLREIQEFAREEIIDLAELGLRTSVLDREAWAIQFTLRSLGRTRGYAEPSKFTVELSGAGGGPIQQEHTIQHLIQEMGKDERYLEACRQRSIDSQTGTIDATFARPVGIPDLDDHEDQKAEAPNDGNRTIIGPLGENREPWKLGGNGQQG